MEYWEKVYTTKQNGFDIALYFAAENDHPKDHFEDDDMPEILRKIDNGTYFWFVAKVTASKHDVELADTYLGGCLYESAKDFVADGYFGDMVAEVTDRAKQKIKDLCECQE